MTTSERTSEMTIKAQVRFDGSHYVVEMTNGTVRAYYSTGYGSQGERESAERMAREDAERVNRNLEFDRRWMAR